MPKTSAGVLLFRRGRRGLEVLLAHPGGPLWARKDDGAWTIPKGELDGGEDPEAAARREFREETGGEIPGALVSLGAVKQPGGKVLHAWAAEGEFEPAALRSNAFAMEWPPRSGRRREFPEIDRVEWFELGAARRKILKGQAELLDRLAASFGGA